MVSRNPRVSNASAQHLRMELDVLAEVESRVQHQRWWSLRFEHPTMEKRFQNYHEESSLDSSRWACGITLGSATALQAAIFYDAFALKEHHKTPWTFVYVAAGGNALLLVLWGIFLWTSRRAGRLGAYFQLMLFALGLGMLMLIIVIGLPLGAHETHADRTETNTHISTLLKELDDAQKAHDVTRTLFFLLILLEIEARYQSKNPYHNALHAASVVWDVNYFLRKLEAPQLTPVQLFSALVAAAIHDVNHPGVNNAFLVATTAPLAIKYSDDSVLERMHLAEAFQICTKDGCDIFEAFPQDLRRQSRLQIISMVLATDLSGHLTHVNRLKSKLYAVHPVSSDLSINGEESSESVGTPSFLLPDELVLQTLIMMADIGHAMKSFPLHLAWSERVAEEFYRQGDTERQFGLTISPLCDRSTGVDRFEKNQIGFLEFVVLPLYTAARDVLPLAGFDDVIGNVQENAATWEKRAQAKASEGDAMPNSPSLAIPATIAEGAPGEEEAESYAEIIVDVGTDSRTKLSVE
ncbi:hypothetical protein PF008_g21456 [Phytophthora fragariae]|uniref:Phosphodiesterase n=1 Tax=Phytophthora fragariae TaxID=53985 RepID=A0A6A3DXH0_9STRA|nr:hypothetical protein PF009_g23388 [Phytophthora fragariae]KAE9306489.1 hypothetical protein PF008_g21456 [Phytophthora fragariae]